MGTRGNVVIRKHKTGRILTNIYHHMDSYPSGLGDTLAQFLKNRVIVNGIGVAEKRKISNSINDLAAQIVTLLKENPEHVGSVYLALPVSPLKDPNDYTYTIYPLTRIRRYEIKGKKHNWHEPVGGVMVVVHNWNKKVFEGTTDEFAKWVLNAD